MKRLAMVVAVLGFAVGMVLAHGEAVRVMGTVTAVSSNSITVQTVDNKSSKVDVSPQTKFVKSGVAASITDLKVGDRVVIDAGKIGEKLDAHQVQFGPTNPPAQRPRQQTLTGAVGDSMCGATHMMKNMSAVECTLMCARQPGQKYALVVGREVYALQGHETDLAKLAGQTARVKGTMNGKTVAVDSVAPAPKAP